MSDERIALDLLIDAAGSARTLGDLDDAVARLREEIKGVEVGSEEFKKMSGAIQQAESRVKTLQKSFEGLEPQQIADSFAKMGEAVVGGFAAMRGAAQLFGEENEDVQEAMMNAQSALSLAIGARMIAEGALQARIAITFTRQKLATIATQLHTAAEQKNTAVKWLAVAATRALNLVLKANPIILIVTAVTALIAAYKLLTAGSDKAKAATEAYNAELERQEQLIERLNTDATRRAELLKAQGKSEERIRMAQMEALLDEISIREDLLEQARRAQQVAIEEGEGVEQALENRVKATEALAASEHKLQVLLAEGRKADKDRLEKQAEEERKRAEERRKAFEARKAEDIKRQKEIEQMEQEVRDKRLEREREQQEKLDKEWFDGLKRRSDAEVAEAERRRKRRKAMAQDRLEQESALNDNLANLSLSLTNIFAAHAETQTNNEKRIIKIQRDATLAKLAIDTASAIGSLTRGAEAVAARAAITGGGVFGIIEGVAFYAAGLARISANILAARQAIRGANTAIASLNATQTSVARGGGGTPGLTPITRGPDIFTGVVTAGAGQNIKVFVTEGDITGTQKRVRRLAQASVIE